MTRFILSSFAVAAMLAAVDVQAGEQARGPSKIDWLTAGKGASVARAVPKQQQLKPPAKTSKAIKKMPDVFISSFQSGGSSSRGKGTPPPPPPNDDCMSCAD